MPNTLAHLGIQGVATRSVIRGADLRWAFTGALLPDLPWILRRALHALAPGIDPYQVHLYATAQASLAVSLLLCGALAGLAATPRRVFAILGLNVLLHLLLDATQEKWGNGVHLLAPLSWELTSFDLYLPESPVTYVLTGFGAVYVGWLLLRAPPEVPAGVRPGGRALGLAGSLLVAYLLAPVFLRGGPERADNHSVRTFRDVSGRAGSFVTFDRRPYLPAPDGGRILTPAREPIRLEGFEGAEPTILSVRGVFLDSATVRALEVRDHSGSPRDLFSYAGIVLIVLVWARGPVGRGLGERIRTTRPARREPRREARAGGGSGPPRTDPPS